MKNFYLLLFILSLLDIFGCSVKPAKQTILFKQIGENELNFSADSSFAIPHGKVWDERRRIHDSCMGSSYAVNAVFMRTKDTFRLGCIVNMRTMEVVKDLRLQNFIGNPVFNFITKPCYEKTPVHISIDSFMNKKFVIAIDSATKKVNNELMEAVESSYNTEIVTGSWVNMELTDALGKILDTTTDTGLLEYRSYLLTPGNMILVRSSGITEISFYFHTKKPLPADLKKKLLNKPITRQSYLTIQLFLINDNSFEVTMNGFFQVIGQFMKCEIQ